MTNEMTPFADQPIGTVEYTPKDQSPQPTQTFTSFLQPTSLDNALQISDALARSTFVPKMYQGQPNNVLVAMQMGSEVGLGPLQALQSICVINNQPSLWGDAMIALVQGSVLCESFEEGFDVESQTGWARTKRRGREVAEQLFTMDMAQKAGLTGKQGPWKLYPERMCKLKARNWLCRDVYPDVLRGLSKLNVVEQDLVQLEDKNPQSSHQQPVKPVKPVKPVDPVIQSLQRPSPKVFRRNAPHSSDSGKPKEKVIESEIVEPDDTENEDLEEYRLAVESLVTAIAEADNESQLKVLKKDIQELPEAIVQQASLVGIWNTRKAQVKKGS